MSKKKGHVKWYRDATDNPLFNVKPYDDWHAFEFLCLKCRRFPGEIVLDDGMVIYLSIGQYFSSRAKLAERFGWSVKKLRAWEDRLFRLKMVTVKGTPKGMVYTVENFEFHQIEGQAKGHAQGQSEGITQGQRIKKEKERIKKETSAGDLEAPRVVPMPDYIRKKIDEVF